MLIGTHMCLPQALSRATSICVESVRAKYSSFALRGRLIRGTSGAPGSPSNRTTRFPSSLTARSSRPVLPQKLSTFAVGLSSHTPFSPRENVPLMKALAENECPRGSEDVSLPSSTLLPPQTQKTKKTQKQRETHAHHSCWI